MAQRPQTTDPDTVFYLRTHQSPAQWLGPFHSEDGMKKARRAWLERIDGKNHWARDVECYDSPIVYSSKLDLKEHHG